MVKWCKRNFISSEYYRSQVILCAETGQPQRSGAGSISGSPSWLLGDGVRGAD